MIIDVLIIKFIYRYHFRFPKIDYCYWNCTRWRRPVCKTLCLAILIQHRL